MMFSGNANEIYSLDFEYVFHVEPLTLRLNMALDFAHVFHAEPQTLRLNML